MLTTTSFIMILIAILILVVLLNKRIRNLITGKADRMVENAEKDDPDAVYRNAIFQLKGDIIELGDLATEATAMAFQVQQEVESQKETLEIVKSDLQLAVAAGDKEIGSALIDRLEAIDKKIVELEERAVEYQANADETIAAKNGMIQELQQLKDEYQQAKTLGKADKMMDRIRSRREGIANDDVSRALDSARSTSLRIKSERHAEKASGAASMDQRIVNLRKGATSGSSGAKFDALMADKK